MGQPSFADQIDPATARTLDRLVRDHPWEGDWSRVRERADRSRRRRRRMPLAISAMAASVLVTLVMVLSVRTDPHAAGNHRWSDPVNGIGIDVEAPFKRASLALAPASHEILSLSTGPLLIGSPTDRLPTKAAAVIGDRGILITIHELEPPEDLAPTGEATPDIGFQERPASFDLNSRAEAGSSFPETRSLVSGNAGMRRWVVPFTDHGRRLIATVIVGANVTDVQLDQANRILDSLTVSPRPVVNPIPPMITSEARTGRLRYIGTVAEHPVYVGIEEDGEVCVLLNDVGMGCSPRAILDGRGLAQLQRSSDGTWFGAIVPPATGTVTVNGVPVGQGPQPILVEGLAADVPVVKQGEVTIRVMP